MEVFFVTIYIYIKFKRIDKGESLQNKVFDLEYEHQQCLTGEKKKDICFNFILNEGLDD